MKLMAVVFSILLFAGCDSTPTNTDKISESPAMDIRGEEVSYDADGVSLKGYIAYDANARGKHPGVLVVHEWWGHDDYARMRARMLAEMGYTALAVDMYGDGKQASHPEDARKFMMAVFNNMEAGKARFMAAKKLLEDHKSTDKTKIAAIGYCFGGAIVLQMARSGLDLKGVASFHGNLSTQAPAKPGMIKAKVLVMNGEDDPFASAEQIAAFKKEMSDAGADMKFINYPGAKHSFTNPAATARGKQFELPLAYNEKADKESWAELDRFLKQVFK